MTVWPDKVAGLKLQLGEAVKVMPVDRMALLALNDKSVLGLTYELAESDSVKVGKTESYT